MINPSTLKPGRELDALVAEKVMGQRTIWFGREGDKSLMLARTIELNEELRERGEMMFGYPGEGDVPHYSTDIEAAWEVVETLKLLGIEVKFVGSWADKPWYCRLRDDAFEFGDTAPHAICLAALKAVGE